MRVEASQHAALALAVTACAVVAACTKKESGMQSSASSGATTSAVTETQATGSTASNAATATPTVLSDANIFALVDEVNMADSSLAAAALPKATRADVKTFAKLMMGEHHALRVQGQQLVKAQHITPELPANDPFKPAVQDEQAAQAAAAKGHAFDSTYIAKEIGVHQAVIQWVGTVESQAQNQALKDLMKGASAVYQRHLNRAEAIQKKLAQTTTG